MILLGRAIFDEDAEEHDLYTSVHHFRLGEPDAAPLWESTQRNHLLWRFLADHAGHTLKVLLDTEIDQRQAKAGQRFPIVGGGLPKDVPGQDYLLDQVRTRRPYPNPLPPAEEC